jgi:hypothetical protein
MVCLKIIKKKNFDKREWDNAKILISKKNLNIIDYENINCVKIGKEEYIALMLEYANAGV